jgi:O-antigen ligase
VLTLLPLASTLWSQDPAPTFRRAIALALSTFFVLYVATRFSPRGFFNLLTVAFAISVVVTIIAAAIPGRGITGAGTYAGAWQGFTGNKNELGRSLALSVALMLPAALLGLTDYRRTALAVGLVSLPLLLLSKSATSLVSAVLAMGLGTAVYVLFGGPIGGFKLRAELRVILGALAVVSGVLLFTVAWTPLLEALGRDPTLTGRTKLWDWAINLNADRRWLGSGYRSFWIDENTRYFFLTFAWNMGPDGQRSDTYAGPTHAHSGYVDLLLELGVVGVAAFAALIISAFASLRRVLEWRSLALGFIFAAIIVFLLVYAITARSLLQQSEALWSLFGLLYLCSIKETLPTRAT